MSRLRSAPKTGNIMRCLQIISVANKKSGWEPKIFPKTAQISKTARFQFRPLPAARQFLKTSECGRQNWFSIIKWRRFSWLFPLGAALVFNMDGLLCLQFRLHVKGYHYYILNCNCISNPFGWVEHLCKATLTNATRLGWEVQ